MSVRRVDEGVLTIQDSLGTKYNNLVFALKNGCFSSGGLAEGTNAGTMQIARAINYTIDGQMYNKAVTDNIAMTAQTAQADNTYRRYLVEINSSGTVSTLAGTAASTAAAAKWPARSSSGKAVIGGVLIATSGGTFTMGTTDLSAAGITDTWYDFGFLDDSTTQEGTSFVDEIPTS